ncbi:putative metallopeptidase, M16 family [Grimontia indica]|uniref:Metallopeptidase, M16 family n=1 Tax=Grimontia indica TaxID=1056512 RepID=R1GSW6_9GAMM|nr:insulinase family protein [Grimontia indica]EOD79154.1 putative metallopeptidase, M16 family [Grimontia indica]
MAKPHPAAPDWLLLPPDEQQLETGWVGYRHVSGALHWHHAASEEDRLSAAIVFPTPVDDDSGITHALEHMVLRGSARYPEPDTFLTLRAELALLEFNATTQKESTRFHLTGYDPHSVLRGIGFMADSVLAPQLADDDFDDEIVRESGDNFEGALYRELGEYMRHERFQQSTEQAAMSEPRAPLYGGMPETVPLLGINDLRRYHNHYYRPESMVILTSGNWPMVALWRQISKSLSNVGKPLPTDVPELSLQANVASENHAFVETLSYSPHWAAALYPTLCSLRNQQIMKAHGAALLPLITDFQPVPALRFRLDDNADLEALHRHVEEVAKRMPSRRVNWQSGYFSLQQGRDMVRRWGDGLQRLYHDFSVTPFAPPFLKGDVSEPLLEDTQLSIANAEWLSPCKPLTRMAILCRCNARDEDTKASLERWLILCQQRTLRWAWMQGQPVLGSMGEWHCANALVLGYTVDLPLEQVNTLRHFWHNHLSADEINVLDGEWQHTQNGIEFYVTQSTPVFRAGSIMASHKDEEGAMHVTLSFPHTVEAGDIATFGQAVMASEMVKKRRLGGRCYSFGVSIDLMTYELAFDTVADSDPSVSFVALLNAMEGLTKPMENSELEKRCQGGLGLVSARYRKSHARFHTALLGTVGQPSAVDFTVVTPTSLADIATNVLTALKHPTVH